MDHRHFSKVRELWDCSRKGGNGDSSRLVGGTLGEDGVVFFRVTSPIHRTRVLRDVCGAAEGGGRVAGVGRQGGAAGVPPPASDLRAMDCAPDTLFYPIALLVQGAPTFASLLPALFVVLVMIDGSQALCSVSSIGSQNIAHTAQQVSLSVNRIRQEAYRILRPCLPPTAQHWRPIPIAF